jgi:hypothetical protein
MIMICVPVVMINVVPVCTHSMMLGCQCKQRLVQMWSVSASSQASAFNAIVVASVTFLRTTGTGVWIVQITTCVQIAMDLVKLSTPSTRDGKKILMALLSSKMRYHSLRVPYQFP